MKQLQGFISMFELLITLLISSLLLSIAIPSFSELIRKNQARTDLNALQHELNYARIHAVSSHTHTLLCPSINQQDCVNDWSQQRMIFADTNANERRDNNEALLLLSDGFRHSRQVVWKSFGQKEFIRYDYLGTTIYQSGRFYWCDIEEKEKQQLIIYRSGRVRKALGSHILDKCS
ncbi:GspH/FimT family protein [Agaribacterium sp. ZY112]|uniref:GspH/FimT family protein n=1 Tax=Agaribacterium sp. ZY112 TaxID=3233574 RepID=UPI0035240161